MKKFILLIAAFAIANSCFSQSSIYGVTSTEFILSSAQYDVFGSKNGRTVRFSPWFNLQQTVHFDFGEIVGISLGGSIKNVGIIHRTTNPSELDPSFSNETITKKFRSYNIGFPVAFKLGSLQNFYLYAGYEFEIPIHYKEKTFIDGNKTKYESEWLSEKMPNFTQSVFLGLNFPYHFGIKVKYYLNEFFNPECMQKVNDLPDITYSDFHARVFYISLTYDLFENFKSYYSGPHVRKSKKVQIYYYE